MCISENFSSSLGTLLPHHILVALRFTVNLTHVSLQTPRVSVTIGGLCRCNSSLVTRGHRSFSIQVWQIYDSEHYSSKITLLMQRRANKNSQKYILTTVQYFGEAKIRSPAPPMRKWIYATSRPFHVWALLIDTGHLAHSQCNIETLIKGTQAWDNFEFFFDLNQILICLS